MLFPVIALYISNLVYKLSILLTELLIDLKIFNSKSKTTLYYIAKARGDLAVKTFMKLSIDVKAVNNNSKTTLYYIANAR